MEAKRSLASVPLFASLDKRTIDKLGEHGQWRVYPPGEPIIKQDAGAIALYVIARGKVRVHERVPDGGPEDQTIGQLGAGDFFGELALIEEHARTASVTAIDETECVLFAAWQFTALLKEHPAMAVPIMNALIARIHRRERHGQT